MPLSIIQSDILAGRGLWTKPARWTLASLAVAYEWAVARRNGQFASGAREVIRLPVPVVSVGNITTGGTGKTPLVIDLAKRLQHRSRTPGIVTRGYKSRPGAPGDEAALISEQLPGVICAQNPDRVAGARTAMDGGADVILMDDGFQHRRLGRDLDVVVLDATNPFGFDRLLPLGRLREPISAMTRADLVVVSRADLVTDADRARLLDRIREVAPRVPSVTCRHRVVGLSHLDGTACDASYETAVLFSAIGNPDAFALTVEGMAMSVAARRDWPDHHPFTPSDIASLALTAGSVKHDVVLTTGKDAMRLAGLDVRELAPLRVVNVEIAFDPDDEAMVESCLDRVLTG